MPALVNLADLDRMRGADERGADLLRQAMALEPDNADVRIRLGLLLVRRHDYAAGAAELRKASELAPRQCALRLCLRHRAQHGRRAPQAMALLEETHRHHPTDRDVLLALVPLAREAGDTAAALRHAREMAALSPDDPQLRGLIEQLERQLAP